MKPFQLRFGTKQIKLKDFHSKEGGSKNDLMLRKNHQNRVSQGSCWLIKRLNIINIVCDPQIVLKLDIKLKVISGNYTFHTEISDGSNMSFLRRADEWVLKGISGYIYGLYLKKTFGVNDYRHWIKEVKDCVSVGLGGVSKFFHTMPISMPWFRYQFQNDTQHIFCIPFVLNSISIIIFHFVVDSN